jgi:hypothetical protein
MIGTTLQKSEQEVPKSVQEAADALVIAKTQLNSEVKIICAEIDSMYKMSSEFSKDTRRLERGVDALPVVEDWVQGKVSALEQLKSQIVFLHKVMDEG